MTPPPDSQNEEYVTNIDQNEVTDEVRNIVVKYDPLNRSGHEGFYVTDDGELHIDESKMMRERKLIEKKILNDAILIVPLPFEIGQLSVSERGDPIKTQPLSTRNYKRKSSGSRCQSTLTNLRW